MAGTLTISTLSDGTNSTSATNCIQGSAKAWVDYSGSAQTIKASFNVSSVTYNAAGNYTINFTTSLADANYALVGFSRNNSATPNAVFSLSATSTSTKTASACQVQNTYWNGSYGITDSVDTCVAFFR